MSPKLQMVNLKSGHIVKKAEDLLLARYDLTELSIKLMSVLIAMLRKDDTEFAHRYILRISDWKELSGLTGRSVYENLLKSAKELQDNPITIQRPRGWLVLNWLASFEYVEESGEIELEISSKLKPYLLELQERFLQYGIENILPLRSSYVIRLYELLKHEYNKITNYNNQKAVIYQISISEMRNKFVIPDSYRYNDIKKNIIIKAQKQFKAKTDIQIDYKEIKKGRAVNSIEFTVRENNKGSNDYLKDETSFISFMRKNFINQDVLKANDKNTNQIIEVSIAANGKLYDKRSTKNIDRKRSKEMWTRLFQLAKKDELLCLKQGTLF